MRVSDSLRAQVVPYSKGKTTCTSERSSLKHTESNSRLCVNTCRSLPNTQKKGKTNDSTLHRRRLITIRRCVHAPILWQLSYCDAEMFEIYPRHCDSTVPSYQVFHGFVVAPTSRSPRVPENEVTLGPIFGRDISALGRCESVSLSSR